MSENKTVIISGGLGDIGQAIAFEFGKRGFRVALGDLLSPSDAASVLKRLMDKGCHDLFYYQVDVTSEKQINFWLQAVEEKWGLPQIIVPNAGTVISGLLTDEKTKYSDVKSQLEVNFWGSYHLAVQAAKKLKVHKLPGRIVFMGSWVAERPAVRISAYCISKAAVRMLCKTLALELAVDNILVNEVAPGIVSAGLSKKNQKKDPELLKLHLNAVPVNRLISVEEVAKQVFCLASFENMNMTGSALFLDGGLSLTSKMTP